MILAFDYASPSALESTRERSGLALSADRRRGVRFHARLRPADALKLRLALQTLGQLVWSDDNWLSQDEWIATLDPVITVHPDRVFFEAFSQDQSSYGLVIVDRAAFETEGEVRHGTTNVDFTAWLWGALGELRTSRETWLHVDSGGLEVRTTGAGGRFERKVDLPDSWVRGFLQLQGAMAMPGTRFTARPVDLLSPLRFLRKQKAKVSPRALRYEFQPGEPVRAVVEPWEEAFVFPRSEHSYTEPRVIRTWGRRRLRAIEPLLPYADEVEVYLKGRAQPSFYAVRLGPVTFVLGLTGWTSQRFTGDASHDLLVDEGVADEALVARALDLVRERYRVTLDEAARELGSDKAQALAALTRLCRAGRVIFDVRDRAFRHRELFAEPIDEARFYPPDPRRERARKMLEGGEVRIAEVLPREERKLRRLRGADGERTTREIVWRQWVVRGEAGDQQCEAIVGDDGRLVFGTCGCEFFREHLLNRGPCEHLIALFRASEPMRRDGPSSRVTAAALEPPKPPGSFDEADEIDDEEDADEDDGR